MSSYSSATTAVLYAIAKVMNAITTMRCLQEDDDSAMAIGYT